MEIQIDPEFKQQIPPLRTEEFEQLQKNILEDGVILNPLILWNGILVDGHNRYRIALDHPHIRYTTVEKEFPDRYSVIAWICKNQLGRRNLTPKQRKYLLGKQYHAEKIQNGGLRNVNRDQTGQFTTGYQNDNLWTADKTCDRIAREHDVSRCTVLRASDYAKAVDIADEVSPGFRDEVLSGSLKPTTKEVQAIVKAKPEERPALIEQIKHPEEKATSIKLKPYELGKKIEDDTFLFCMMNFLCTGRKLCLRTDGGNDHIRSPVIMVASDAVEPYDQKTAKRQCQQHPRMGVAEFRADVDAPDKCCADDSHDDAKQNSKQHPADQQPEMQQNVDGASQKSAADAVKFFMLFMPDALEKSHLVNTLFPFGVCSCKMEEAA